MRREVSISATLWFALLMVQPLLIRSGRRSLHRRLGYASGLLAPAVLIGIVLGAHSRVGSFDPALWDLGVNLLIGLIWAERDARRGRWAFPTVLGIFLAMEIPLWAGFTESSTWDAFGRGLLSLPLT